MHFVGFSVGLICIVFLLLFGEELKVQREVSETAHGVCL